MTALHESRVPYPRNGRLWDETITGTMRLHRHDFLLMLGIDPARVPDGARIEHDETTDEYRLQVINPGGHLVWVRRLLRPPFAAGGLVAAGRMAAAFLPQLAGAIDPTLAQLRAAFAAPMGHRRLLGEPEPAVFDRERYEASLAELRASLPEPQPTTGDPMRVFPPSRGYPVDVTIIDDPVRTYDPAVGLAGALVDSWDAVRGARTYRIGRAG